MVANTYLEGTYSEIYPEISEDAAGMRKLFRQFSFPGGIPSHAAPDVPGSIHEGGELGYALSHAYGAAFDNPDLVVACVVGDGEAETGPLAAAWHSNKFLNPARDGAVLPILHLNGYKIANPPSSARIPDDDLANACSIGYGYEPLFVEGHEPALMHETDGRSLSTGFRSHRGESSKPGERMAPPTDGVPRWPMIVLRSPKGWTGPKEVDGKKVEGFWRAHQVPVSGLPRPTKAIARSSKTGCEATIRKTCSTPTALSRPESATLSPVGEPAWAPTPHANGGLLRRNLIVPDIRNLAPSRSTPGGGHGRVDAKSSGAICATCHELNEAAQLPDRRPGRNGRPTAFKRVRADRARLDGGDRAYDVHLSRDGRVMEILSEHLPGLAGRLSADRPAWPVFLLRSVHPHRRFHVQPACQMAEASAILPWRKPIASLNYLLTSMSGARTTTASASGSWLHRRRRSTRRPTSSASTCRRMPTRCSG
jgi:xylulose-5-phosphate/fructose-6-phosphate phosphoketolase